MKSRVKWLHSRARSLAAKFTRGYGTNYIDEAIAVDREALSLCPSKHSMRYAFLELLSFHLWIRYERVGLMKDLDEAIVLDREALSLRPVGHPTRSTSLNNLAVDLSTLYDTLGAMEDLNEAIVLDQEALSLRPVGHPTRSTSLNSLAVHLSIRYNTLGAMEDLNEAIVLDREALSLRPEGHPDRSTTLCDLADNLRIQFTQSSQLDDKEEIFRLYANLAYVPQTASSRDIFATKSWVRAAEHFHHPTTLLAYETSLRLLVHHLATLPSLPQHLAIFKTLVSSLSVDAFSACLRNQLPARAVELLEQGRGVFWTQLTRLRSPLDDVIASGPLGKTLAHDFTQLTSLIRSAINSPGTDQHDRICNLNVELEKVVTSIRKLPGLSRFLLPLLFADLQQAAHEGPVIVVNASEYGCDALAVLIDRDPVHIPLSITKERARELSSKFHTLTMNAKKRMDVTRDLRLILRRIWDEIVSPITETLSTIHPVQSRIWWCPTAEFSHLPLHAAAPYRTGQPSFANLYISSYTPTLAALIHARRHNTPRSLTRGKCFAAIGQGAAIGENELVSVGIELANIGQRVDGLARFTRVEGPESCIARVAEELGKNEWVHFACHGLPNPKQPFESAFALHDGKFTIQQIIKCNLENPEFAYLSACHTTVGDEESPDEVIHLVSAMQFVGFRSVIGTMWAVDDSEAPKITSMFYDNMSDESGQLDYTRAAFALHETMRKVEVSLDQRILYVHFGA